VTWSIPLEVSVRIPALAREPAAVAPTEVGPPLAEPPQVERALRPSKDYRDRSGYKPKFIKGFTVPLPTLSSKQEKLAARNRRAEPGDDPFELKYHHFSLVLHARRKLAFFTACNIDGTHAKKVNRKTGEVSDLDVSSAFSEALGGPEDSEAREEWASDDRLLLSEQTNQALYDSQQVPGFPGGSSAGRLARMFQRGHLVRRMDPAWGTNDQARLADADTFHFTNCAPQLGFFNMGSAAKLKLDGSGGGKLWRALENHVLGNAVAEGLRVCSLTGPVFGADDIPWRGILVPLKFWKVVVWAEDGALRSLAMLADQLPVIQAVGKLPESLSDAEAFDELDEVEDFLSTVATIERLTGLDLGDQVREADIRAGEPESRVEAFEEIALAASTRARKTKKTVRKPRRK
jgi:endonuclease G